MEVLCGQGVTFLTKEHWTGRRRARGALHLCVRRAGEPDMRSGSGCAKSDPWSALGLQNANSGGPKLTPFFA
jgi:hypothetical protein